MLSVLKKESVTSDAYVFNENLEELLKYMVRYGKPKLSYMGDGWYCRVEMNTNTTGTQFEVSSEFKHPTPIAAVKQCHERIVSALKALS